MVFKTTHLNPGFQQKNWFKKICIGSSFHNRWFALKPWVLSLSRSLYLSPSLSLSLSLSLQLSKVRPRYGIISNNTTELLVQEYVPDTLSVSDISQYDTNLVYILFLYYYTRHYTYYIYRIMLASIFILKCVEAKVRTYKKVFCPVSKFSSPIQCLLF